MKMKKEDYQKLGEALWQYSLRHNLSLVEKLSEYKKEGLSEKRFLWDLLHASHYDITPLYGYLNDSHIETALKKIVHEIQ